MAEIVIHGINTREFAGKKGGTFRKCSIKYRGIWYSGNADEITDTWDVGMAVNVDLWMEESQKDGKTYGQFVRIKPYARMPEGPNDRPTTTIAKQSDTDPAIEGAHTDIDRVPDPNADLPF